MADEETIPAAAEAAPAAAAAPAADPALLFGVRESVE
jgi:hypothetical protein